MYTLYTYKPSAMPTIPVWSQLQLCDNNVRNEEGGALFHRLEGGKPGMSLLDGPTG